MEEVSRRPRPEAEPLDLRVLYEDASLIGVDKPPGMVVHPTYRNWSGTLLNGLLWHVQGTADERPSILTRLDKDTSGLVLAARTPEVQAIVQRDMAAGRVRKEYLALVAATVEIGERGTIELPLARSAEDRRLVVVSDAGARCETRYEVLASAGGRSLVRCELVTGRTHQIRVHLAARGWPIAGDATYGTPAPDVPRQALHAWRIQLPHPLTREPVTIEAPWPADLPRT